MASMSPALRAARREAVLGHLRENPRRTVLQIRTAIGETEAAVRTVVGELHAEGVLERGTYEGSRGYCYWIPEVA